MAEASPIRILFVEDVPEDYEIAVQDLRRSGMEFDHMRVDTREDFLDALDSFRPDIVISDYSMPNFDGMSALNLSLERDRLLPFIIITGSMNEDTAVACMKAGAMDYLIKGHSGRLPFAVRDALERCRLLREKERIISALRESELNYRTLADSGQALIWTSNAEGLCTYFNKPWMDFTGRTFQEEWGNGWLEGVHPEDREACIGIYTAAFAKRENFSMEYRLRRNDGEYRWVQDDGSPRYNTQGRFLGYIGHCLDITERRRDAESIQKTLAEKEILLREIFHRTRNSMQVIMSILAFEEDAAQDDRICAIVRKTGQRVMSMAMVQQELYNSKDLSKIDLRDYTERLLEELGKNESDLGGRIAVGTELESIPVLIDAAMPFGLVLHELIYNALRHAFPDGRQGTLRIRLAGRSRGPIVLEVQDDGVGMPADYMERPGKTLGLQLLQGLVEQQLGGSVEIEQHSGVLCRISFTDAHFIKRV